MEASNQSAAAGRLGLGASSDGQSLMNPESQLVSVLEKVFGHLIVVHAGACLAKRTKRAHAKRLECRTRGLVRLEVQGIVVDEGEEQIVCVDADGAEHPPRPHARGDAAQLIEDESLEARADRHGRRCSVRRSRRW